MSLATEAVCKAKACGLLRCQLPLTPMRTQLFSLLIRPPTHSRARSITIVLGLCLVFAASYVAARGSFGNLAFNLVPLVLAVSWLGLGWGISVSVVITALRVFSDVANLWLNPDYYLADANLMRLASNRVSTLVMFWCIAVLIHELIVMSRQLEERVKARTEALNQATAAREKLQHRLLEAGVRERAAIGRDLHDGLGQHLAATAMAASILSTQLKTRDDALAGSADQVESLIRDGITQTRRIARGLLLDSVSAGQLELELEELLSTATENFHIPCRLHTSGPVDTLDATTSSHLFYIAREALRNSLRHAEATHIDVQLTVQSTHAELQVIDDGVGLGLPASVEASEASDVEGVGLQIMNQRAQFMGGTLRFLSPSPSGAGTQLECRVPLVSQAA